MGVGHEWGVVAVEKLPHNFRHHMFTNVLGMDDDVGYSMLRVTRDQPWTGFTSATAAEHLLAVGFEWGMVAARRIRQTREAGPRREKNPAANPRLLDQSPSAGGQGLRLVPRVDLGVAGGDLHTTLKANMVANVIRNLWAYVVIFCGHVPEGAEKFTARRAAERDQGRVVSAADAGRGELQGRAGSWGYASGNLCYQIEHHLFPDLPSNRLAEIAERVRPLCEKYDLPYTTGSFLGSMARRGAPSPSCHCRTATCATPPTTLRRPAASGCSPNFSPASPVPTW